MIYISFSVIIARAKNWKITQENYLVIHCSSRYLLELIRCERYGPLKNKLYLDEIIETFFTDSLRLSEKLSVLSKKL